MSVDLEHELMRLHDDGAAVDRGHRGAVLVTGRDGLSFLQALVSADVDALADGEGTHCLLLTPQGKLDVDVRLLRVGDDAWLDCEPGLGARLAASLQKFRIRVQADIVDRSDEQRTVSLVGPLAVARFEERTGVQVPAALHAHVAWGDVRVVRADWGGVAGVDLLGPAPVAPEGFAEVGPVVFEAFRIERGVPRQPLDLDDATIPQEAFLERDAVSFTKGCFLGQELVCRIDSRGHVNRFLRRFGSIDGAWPTPGAEVVADGKVVGTLTSVAPAELPTGALGYVRREVDPPAQVELRWEHGTARAVVEELAVS